MAKYRSYCYQSIKKVCGQYLVFDEKEEQLGTKDRDVNREWAKSLDSSYVVVKKWRVKDYYNRALFDYEIYTNGVRDEIEVNGWKFPFFFEDDPVWGKGNYCHIACLSPKGITINLEYVDTGAIGLFESFGLLINPIES